MSRNNIFVFALLFAFLAPEFAFAQRGASRGGYRRGSQEVSERPDKDKKEKKEKKRSRRKKKNPKEEDDAPPPIVVGSDKESIEAYLQKRLGEAKKFHREQDKWGRGLASSWGKFWAQMYEERKSFEIRIARQRLNLFESLDSLDSAFHGQTIGDFERLQNNIMKSFESQQQQKMKDYFSILYSDLRAFQSEQEAARERLGREAMDAWNAQKASSKAKR